MKKFWEFYGWLRNLMEGNRPVFEDPKMQKVFDDYLDATQEYQDGLDSGRISLDNFTEEFVRIVGPKRKAYEDYQTLKAMGVKMTPVEEKDHTKTLNSID